MKSWTKVRGELPPESRTRMDQRLKEALATMPLDKMRKARSMTQTAVAETAPRRSGFGPERGDSAGRLLDRE